MSHCRVSARCLAIVVAALVLAACGHTALSPDPVAVAQLPTAQTPVLAPTQTPSPSLPPTVTPRPTATFTPTPSPTPDPYAGLTIADLRAAQDARAAAYRGDELTVEEDLGANEAFTRLLISYPSGDLTIHGFMNVPHGDGPFPVAIVLHGYIDPAVYQTLAYTTRYADALARAGYLTIHPNLRGYPPSDEGPNRFRVGMAEDVLNLLALVRAAAGGEGPLSAADPDAIGMMGHSMGGGITLRVITVDPGVGAAVLYGSMSADEQTNYEQTLVWSGGARGRAELETSDEDLARISPGTYLGDVTAAISIHHSEADATVPVAWSEALHERLLALGKDVEYYAYQNTPHTFRGEADATFMARMIAFFDLHLRSPAEPAAAAG